MNFEERQFFFQNRLAVAVVGLLVVIVGGALWQTGVETLLESAVLIGGLLAVLIVPVYPYLITTVDGHRLRVRFPPADGREITSEDIRRFEVADYSPLGEFGGWGFRIGGRRKRAYNVSGSAGLRLWLADGHEIVIGTRRPAELRDAVAAMCDEPGTDTRPRE